MHLWNRRLYLPSFVLIKPTSETQRKQSWVDTRKELQTPSNKMYMNTFLPVGVTYVQGHAHWRVRLTESRDVWAFYGCSGRNVGDWLNHRLNRVYYIALATSNLTDLLLRQSTSNGSMSLSVTAEVWPGTSPNPRSDDINDLIQSARWFCSAKL
jgi:hypothetical protein